jgi:hypothetical protein
MERSISKKSFSPEQIIATLRHSEVQLVQGKSIAPACKEAARSDWTKPVGEVGLENCHGCKPTVGSRSVNVPSALHSWL